MQHLYTAFSGSTQVAAGGLPGLVVAAHAWLCERSGAPMVVIQDHTGSVIDLDLRTGAESLLSQLDGHPMLEPMTVVEPVVRGRGRPRLGVVSREISLLPRHWAWLKTQRGSASGTLRMLIEERMKAGLSGDQAQVRVHATYAAMKVLAGDRACFEEASRALFAHDVDQFATQVEGWPDDVRGYLTRLLEG